MTSSLFLAIVQTRISLQCRVAWNLESFRPHKGELLPILKWSNSTRPFAKVSTRIAEGNWKTFAISFAAVSSGLMIMLNPNSFWRKSFSSLYIGLRMRAMVWQWPLFLAMTQQRRFSSSEPVTAISRSAVSIPACFNVVWLTPFPTIPITSTVSVRALTFSGRESITTILWFSLLKASTSVHPTLPQPTIIIFMIIRYLSFLNSS